MQRDAWIDASGRCAHVAQTDAGREDDGDVHDDSVRDRERDRGDDERDGRAERLEEVEAQPAAPRFLEDRGRVLEEIVRLQTDDCSAQPQRVGRDSKERDEDRPGEDADGAEWSYQARACATRSGSSSASARSISSRVLK